MVSRLKEARQGTGFWELHTWQQAGDGLSALCQI